MTDGVWEIVGRNRTSLPAEKSLSDALRDLIQRRHKSDARKYIEQSWGLDPKTARNVVQSGHVSERTLTKAAKAERWALWHALGEEMFGETYEQFLQGVIDETDRARERACARRDHIRSLEARAASVVALLDRSAA